MQRPWLDRRLEVRVELVVERARAPSSSRRTARRARGRPAGSSGTSNAAARCSARSPAPSSPITGTTRPARERLHNLAVVVLPRHASAARGEPRLVPEDLGLQCARAPRSARCRAPRRTDPRSLVRRRAPRPGARSGRARASVSFQYVSRSGCCDDQRLELATTSPDCPTSMSASIRCSIATSRSSSSRWISLCAK